MGMLVPSFNLIDGIDDIVKLKVKSFVRKRSEEKVTVLQDKLVNMSRQGLGKMDIVYKVLFACYIERIL